MIYLKVLDGNKSCNGGDATWRIGRWRRKSKCN